jgi:hypothetical protein
MSSFSMSLFVCFFVQLCWEFKISTQRTKSVIKLNVMMLMMPDFFDNVGSVACPAEKITHTVFLHTVLLGITLHTVFSISWVTLHTVFRLSRSGCSLCVMTAPSVKQHSSSKKRKTTQLATQWQHSVAVSHLWQPGRAYTNVRAPKKCLKTIVWSQLELASQQVWRHYSVRSPWRPPQAPQT